MRNEQRVVLTPAEAPKGKPADRRREIAEYVVRNGPASAAGLAERFQVSLMTVHRDLDELERQGVVRKYRGGVTAQSSSVFESHVTYRLGQAADAKAAIAREAKKLIEPGMAVMLDDSTSALALAQLLNDVTPLTVMTNFLEIVRLVSTWRDARLITLGGEYNASHDSFLGVPCVDAIAGLRADVVFVSISTLARGYVYHQEQEIVFVKRAMLTAAERRILLVDHTKLGRRALHRVAPLADFDMVITDDGAGEEVLRELRESGVETLIAPALPEAEPEALRERGAGRSR
jgi:DeoR/GlpR family transcriptional regulator of sugar metabolism